MAVRDSGRRVALITGVGGQDGTYLSQYLLALGYNAGGGNMRIFARGRKAGSQAQSYVDRLHDNWAKSAEALKS